MGVALATAALVMTGCSRGGGNKLATVNGDSISLDEFYQYLEIKPTVRVMVNGQATDAQVADTIGFQAFQDLIGQKLLLQMAADENLIPNDADVTKELDFQKKLNPQLVDQLRARGMDLTQIKDSLKIDLSRERLMTKGVKVTEADVDDFIKKNPDTFTEPATIDMLWIFITDIRKQKDIDSELESGQGFSTVALRYSEDPNAREAQGRFPVRVQSQIPQVVLAQVQNLPAGKSTGWFKANNGWCKCYVDSKKPAKPIQIDAVKRELVKRQVALQRGRQSIDLGKRLADRLKTAKIEVVYEAMKAPWKEVVKKLQEAGDMKTDTTATSKSK